MFSVMKKGGIIYLKCKNILIIYIFCIKEMISMNIMLISTNLKRFMCNIAMHCENEILLLNLLTTFQ